MSDELIRCSGCVWAVSVCCDVCCFFFFQAEDGIRDLVRSRGLGDVYKRQVHHGQRPTGIDPNRPTTHRGGRVVAPRHHRRVEHLSLIHI